MIYNIWNRNVRHGALAFAMAVSVMISPVFAQYEYRVGNGQSSIEPDHRFFSLTLAGYGVPPEGRFTLNWTAPQALGAVDDAVILSGSLYYLSGGGLWVLPLTGNPAEPKEIHPDVNLRLLTANNGRLYGISENNELLEINPKRRNAKWQRIAAIDKDAAAFAYTDTGFVVIDDAGGRWHATGMDNALSWKKSGVDKQLIDVLFKDKSLYGLTAENEVLKLQDDGTWLRIALGNGLTYDQDIRLILAGGEGFYGITGEGQLVKAAHNSTQHLSAGALSIRSNGDRVILVGLDVCGFDADFASIVKGAIYRRFGVPPSAVLINASHTHFAPVTQSWATWAPHCQKPDSSYLNNVVKTGILEAVSQAVKDEQPANLYFGRTTADIGHNRNLTGNNLPYDKDLDVVKVEYQHKRHADILFLAGCHPVFSNSGKEGITISPNYPGVARETLTGHAGINSALFLQGCGGDINPTDENHRVTAQKVVAAVQTALQGEMAAIEGKIDYHLDTINFDTQPWSVERIRQFRKENEGKEGNVVAEKNVRWADLMLSHHKNGTMPTTMPVYIQTLNIGDWKLVGVSREATTEYSLGIKNLWPDKLVSVAGYSNDVSSYLPTSRHIHAGIYEGKDSFFWYGQPNVFPENVYEVIIDEVKKNNR